MDSASAAVLGALIGASGAVIAQIVSAYFTGRRETKKYERDIALDIDRRFLELKREQIAEFRRHIRSVNARLYEIGDTTGSERDLTLARLEADWQNELNRMYDEIADLELIAPELGQPALDVLRALDGLKMRLTGGSDYGDEVMLGSAVDAAIEACIIAMRKSLGLGRGVKHRPVIV